MKKNKYEIYERIWDLREENRVDLEKVGLEKGMYIYRGKASAKTYLSNRESCWKYKYKNKKLPNKVQDFMERLEKIYINKGISEEERYRLMFKNCKAIDYARDKKELKLKEKIYITRVDLVSRFIDGLIVEEPVISLNTNNSMVRVKEYEGIRVTSIGTQKVS